MQKVVTWAAQAGIALALAAAAALARDHGVSLLLASMAGGVVIASGVGLGVRGPDDPAGPGECAEC
jgi:hypothetical protein